MRVQLTVNDGRKLRQMVDSVDVLRLLPGVPPIDKCVGIASHRDNAAHRGFRKRYSPCAMKITNVHRVT